jgi:ABC-type transporter Mla subunit MlaD
MDPLSFSASLITVIGAAAALTKGLNKLQRELRDTSGTLTSLVNETTDLRLLLDATDSALREWRTVSGQTLLPPSFNKVDDVLNGLTKNLNALSDIVRRCLAERDPESGKFLSNVARVKWLKDKKKAKPFQKALQESKKDLLVLLEAHNL